MCSLNIHKRQLVLNRNYVNCFVRLFTCMVILKLFLVGVHVWTHMNIRLAHVLVDDSVSQVIDMEISNL
jgi:predicted ABC-type exoprotein transport system permease subunit